MNRVAILCLLVASTLQGSQRTVVAEEFTRTSCSYCPGAARGLVENYERSYDSLIVIAYHSGDPFANPEATTRFTYYSVTGTPTAWFDGALSEVGGLGTGTMYPFYRHHVTTRTGVDSPLEITLYCSYDSITNQGTIDATVENTSASAVSGNIHFVVIEDHIPYNWGGLTEVNHVMRDMIPDANGEAVTIPVADTIIRSRNFTIDPTWNELNCEIVVFIQGASRAVYQGAEIGIVPQMEMVYYGLTLAEVTGNGNGYAEPGELIQVEAIGKNMGTGTYTDPTAVFCNDPYVSVSQIFAYVYSLEPGDADTVLGWTFTIDPGCPTPYIAEFFLCFACGDTSTIPLMITTQPGIADNMESGEGDWTHSGTYDNWHLTEYKSNSPTHSWYCGVENLWHYTNQNDASLVSRYFVVPPDSALTFFHQYGLETNWDYAYVEINNGSGWWLALDEYNGSQSAWTQASYSLSDYNGQTVRVRFRFISDYSAYEEGWYIDDVLVPMLGVQELDTPHEPQTISLSVHPNIIRHSTEIRYTIGEANQNISGSVGVSENQTQELKIYDATGRLVRSFNHESWIRDHESMISWDGTDQANRKLGNGVYFVKLLTTEQTLTEKVILLR